MHKGLPSIAAIAVAVLCVAALAGTLAYYNGTLNDRNQKIALLSRQIAINNDQISNLTSQVSKLQSEIANSTSANLVATLGVNDVGNTSSISRSYNRLFIEGSVTNNGQGEALNAGLHVSAYAADGTLEINMTVPLTYGEFGTSGAIYSYICTFDPYCTSSQKFENLSSGRSANVNLDIYHEGTVSNWTITPTWTNAPGNSK